MAHSEEVLAFWERFRAERSISETRFEVWSFGDSPELADELLDYVLNGPKRATATLLLTFERNSEHIPEVGEYSVVLDSTGKPRCVLRTFDVVVKPYREVDAAFAYDEGEGDRTLESWKRDHNEFFARQCERYGVEFEETMPVVFERFQLVYKCE